MRFFDLGVLQVEVDGVVQSPGGARPAAVLSTLLLHPNQRVSVDLLVDAVWGEAATDRAFETLGTHVWRLRRLLEPRRSRREAPSVLLSESGGYRLAVTDDQVDSARFEQLSREVTDLFTSKQPRRALAAADEALSLWRGDAFVDIAERSWAAGSLARLAELRIQVQERRIDAVLATGDPDRAISDLHPLLARHPLRERLWWQQMLACYRAGRIEEALRHYQTARRVLLDDLGLEPGPELSSLQSRILARDPGLTEQAPLEVSARARTTEVRLPPQVELIGRSVELQELQSELSQHPLVTVVGSAGSGKTSIAVEVGRTLTHLFADGIWFVDLSTVSDPDETASTVAAALGLVVPKGGSTRTTVTAFGRDRQALIVLDNCEHVLDAVHDICVDLVRPARELHVLATSREPLGLDEETVYPLGPLATSTTSSTGTRAASSAESAAVQLFLHRDKTRKLGAVEEEDLVTVRRLCQAVDGLPLAIELAAAWTPYYSLDEIAQQVRQDPSALATVGRGQARHHHTLHAAIEFSYRLLSKEEQSLHRRLSVLPGAFSRELAESLSEDADQRRRTAGLLARLAHRSLLTVARSPEGTRFAQLATVRSHASHALAHLDEVEAVADRRDRWTLQLIRDRPFTGRPEEAVWYERITSNLAVVRATLQRSLVATPVVLGSEVAAELLGYWYYRGLTYEGLQWLSLAVSGVADSGHRAVLKELVFGSLLALEGRADDARAALARAADLPATTGHEEQLAEVLVSLASTFSTVGDAVSIRRTLALAEPLIAVSGNPALPVAAEAVDCLAEAIEEPTSKVAERAREVFERASLIGNLWASWLTCSTVCYVALTAGDAQLGLVWSRRLLGLQNGVGAHAVLPQFETFADFLALSGDVEHAVRTFSATYDVARRSGARWPRNAITRELLTRAQQQLSEARFDEAWALGRTLGRAQLLELTPLTEPTER